jgi:hypothetical protein
MQGSNLLKKTMDGPPRSICARCDFPREGHIFTKHSNACTRYYSWQCPTCKNIFEFALYEDYYCRESCMERPDYEGPDKELPPKRKIHCKYCSFTKWIPPDTNIPDEMTCQACAEALHLKNMRLDGNSCSYCKKTPIIPIIREGYWLCAECTKLCENCKTVPYTTTRKAHPGKAVVHYFCDDCNKNTFTLV